MGRSQGTFSKEDALMEDAKAVILACEDGEEVSVERNEATDELFEQFFLANGFVVNLDEKFLYASRPKPYSATNVAPVSLEVQPNTEYVQSGPTSFGASQAILDPENHHLDVAVLNLVPHELTNEIEVESSTCASRKPSKQLASEMESLSSEGVHSSQTSFASPSSHAILERRHLDDVVSDFIAPVGYAIPGENSVYASQPKQDISTEVTILDNAQTSDIEISSIRPSTRFALLDSSEFLVRSTLSDSDASELIMNEVRCEEHFEDTDARSVACHAFSLPEQITIYREDYEAYGTISALTLISPALARCCLSAVQAIEAAVGHVVRCCFSVQDGSELTDIREPLIIILAEDPTEPQPEPVAPITENRPKQHGVLTIFKKVYDFATTFVPDRLGRPTEPRPPIDTWVDFTPSDPNREASGKISGFGEDYKGRLPQNQVAVCSFSLESSYKRDSKGGFLVRIVIKMLRLGVRNSFLENNKRGYFVENFILSIEPEGSSCGLVHFTPEVENDKAQVVNNKTRNANAGLALDGVNFGLAQSIGENVSYDSSLWSWKPVFDCQKSSACQFSWNMESWKAPRKKYDYENPKSCGFPIPELPHNGESVILPSGITSVTWSIPPKKVTPMLKLSWSFTLKAKLRFLEIKKYPFITTSFSDKKEANMHIEDVVKLDLP